MRVNEQGRSMIEMLGVLAIVGVLSVGGIAGYSKAMNKFKTNKIGDQIQMISTNIRTLFSSQRTYAGLNNGMALRAGLIPGEMYEADSGNSYSANYAITNAFGGGVYIAVANQTNDTGGPDNKGDQMAFTIAVDQIPQSACVSIATTDWGGDAGGGLSAMWIGAGAANSASGLATTASLNKVVSGGATSSLHIPGDDEHGLPYNISDANTACAQDLNGVVWKYF